MKRLSVFNIVAMATLAAVPFVTNAQNERESRSSRSSNESRRESSPVRTERSERTTSSRAEQVRPHSQEDRSQSSRRESSSTREVYQPQSTPATSNASTSNNTPQVRTQSMRESRDAGRTVPSTVDNNQRMDNSVSGNRVYTQPSTQNNGSRDGDKGRTYERNNSYSDRGNTYNRDRDRDRGNDNNRTYERRYDRRDARTQYRYEGRYEGRWDNRHVEKWKVYGYGKPRYVVYNRTRVYRAPYFTGIIRVRPPFYTNMPVVVYPEQRIGRPFHYYRPFWSDDYMFVRRWVFFPRLNIYWDNYSNVFVYFHRHKWRVSASLPRFYFSIDLLNEPMFEVEEDYDSEDGYYDDGYYYYED
jgi:hypothetical protein